MPALSGVWGRAGSQVQASLQSLIRSVGMRHGLILSAAMILAGALDYVANVLAGRWLAPVEFGVFVSVAAILPDFFYLSIPIPHVLPFSTPDLSPKPPPTTS